MRFLTLLFILTIASLQSFAGTDSVTLYFMDLNQKSECHKTSGGRSRSSKL